MYQILQEDDCFFVVEKVSQTPILVASIEESESARVCPDKCEVPFQVCNHENNLALWDPDYAAARANAILEACRQARIWSAEWFAEHRPEYAAKRGYTRKRAHV